MPPQPRITPTTEAVISVSEMARRVTLSRARFYELVQEGIFPAPIYCVFTRRAMYPLELQQQCLDVRATNVGVNGRYILFYRARTVSQATPSPRRAPSNQPGVGAAVPLLTELRQGLAALGMATVSEEHVRNALSAAYPHGTAGTDSGAVLASVFRLIRSPNHARTTIVPEGLPRVS